jgi:alpha-amylase
LHKDQGKVTLTYHFDGAPQSSECKRYNTGHTSLVALKVTGSDGTKLEIPAVTLIWNVQKLADRPGDFRNGQKGAIPELFGFIFFNSFWFSENIN